MIKKILLARTDAIGDAVLTLPCIEALHHHYPEADIYVYCTSTTKPIFMHNPYVTEIIVEGKRSIFVESKRLKEYNFDLFITFHKNDYYSFLSFLAGIKERVGFRDNWICRLFYTKSAVPPWRDALMHQIDYNFVVLGLLGINTTKNKFRPKLYIPKPYKKENRIAIAIDSRPLNRMWYEKGYVELIKLLISKYKINIVLLGDEKAQDMAIRIENEIRNNLLRVKAGSLSLADTITEIASSSYFIGPDSGLMHIAASFGLPILTFFIAKNQQPARYAPFGCNYELIIPDYLCQKRCFNSACKLDICKKKLYAKDLLSAFDNLINNQSTPYSKEKAAKSVFKLLYIGVNQSTQEFMSIHSGNFFKPIKILRQCVNYNINIVISTHKLLNILLEIFLPMFVPTYPVILENDVDIISQYKAYIKR